MRIARLRCQIFRLNEVRLGLRMTSSNLDNLWRRLVLPKESDCWPLSGLQQQMVEPRGRSITHARYYWLLLAESHLTRRLSGSMVRRIAALSSPPG